VTAKKKAAPAKPAPAERIKPRVGFLSCEHCKTTVQHTGNPDDPSGWPQHRCGFNVRPFTTWTPNDPAHMPLSPLEEP
jgi:hypothetical protein